MAQKIVHHAILADKSKLVMGENALICTMCDEPIVLLWDGVSFSLREKDANDPSFGKVDIAFTA